MSAERVENEIVVGSVVMHQGAPVSVAAVLDRSKDNSRDGRYPKPQIVAHRIKGGKILFRTNLRIGKDYEQILETTEVDESTIDHNYESIIVYAARYAHTRNTGASLQVVNYILRVWQDLSDDTCKQLARESTEATCNKNDWIRIVEAFNGDY